jgi:hypothetical protein
LSSEAGVVGVITVSLSTKAVVQSTTNKEIGIKYAKLAINTLDTLQKEVILVVVVIVVVLRIDFVFLHNQQYSLFANCNKIII